MNRRGFIKGVAGLFVAPAIVKAENIMRIWVPPQGVVSGFAPQRAGFPYDDRSEEVLLSESELLVVSGNRLLTPHEMTRKTLKGLNENMGVIYE